MAFLVCNSIEEWAARFGDARRTAVTVGNFDGLHLGPPEDSAVGAGTRSRRRAARRGDYFRSASDARAAARPRAADDSDACAAACGIRADGAGRGAGVAVRSRAFPGFGRRVHRANSGRGLARRAPFWSARISVLGIAAPGMCGCSASLGSATGSTWRSFRPSKSADRLFRARPFATRLQAGMSPERFHCWGGRFR